MKNDENHAGEAAVKFELVPRFQSPPKTSLVLRKALVDLSAIVLLLIPILCLFLWGKPYHRGFNCDDDSLRYPYLDNTISSLALYFYSTLIPIFVIGLNEFLILRYQLSSNQVRSPVPNSFWKCYIWQVYLQLVPLAFAAASSQVVTDVAKYSIGRLRPHFIDRCRPQLPNGQILFPYSTCDKPHEYVTDYKCTSSLSAKTLRDSHLSFMSGHSSFAAVCLLYLVIYIQIRVQWTIIGLLKSFVQFSLICLVIYTGLSRISDYKHHWSDVLTGLIQGTIVAVLVACFVSDLLKPRSYQISRPNSAVATSQVDSESGV